MEKDLKEVILMGIAIPKESSTEEKFTAMVAVMKMGMERKVNVAADMERTNKIYCKY
jgi:hypothetical protein